MLRRFFSIYLQTFCLVFVASPLYADLVIKNGETLALNSITPEILIVRDNLVIEADGTLQGGNNTEIRVNGDWNNSANGNFTHANTKVVFTGSDVSIIKGNNHFHDLIINKKEAVVGKKFTGTEIQIESGTTQTISSQLILKGVEAGDRLKIRSTINGESHTLNVSNAAYVETRFLDIDDSILTGDIDMPENFADASPIIGNGNNEGWIANSAPTISGTPDASVAEDTAYSFIPSVTDADADHEHTFSINDKKPIWASFNPETGALTGTPTNSDVGSYPGIVITVSDGVDSVFLESFTIEVTNTNDAPTISGTPDASVAEDTAYAYGIDALPFPKKPRY